MSELRDDPLVSGTAQPRTPLRAFLGDRRGPIAGLVASSIAGGLLEAAILALVAQVAASLVRGGTRVVAVIGSVHVDASIGELLGLAAGIAVVRFALAILVAYLPARIGADVEAGLRNSLFEAFTDASWTVQAAERGGHLQDLMTNQIAHATQGVLNAANFLSAICTFLALVVA